MMIPTYVAAPFSRKEMVLEIKEALQPLGYEILERWTTHQYKFAGGIQSPENYDVSVQSALDDIADCMRAQIVIVLLEPHEGSKYGWLTELGIAIASNNCDELWLVGEPFNVFCVPEGLHSTEDGYVLPRITRFKDVKELLMAKGVK